MEKYRLRIQEVVAEAPDTVTYRLERPESFSWEAGAHVHIGIPGFDEQDQPNKKLVRHLSISTLPDEGTIGITTRLPGSGSPFKTSLSELKAGDDLILFKPGSRMGLRRDGRPLILLSMGVGIATIRPVILSWLANPDGVPEVTSLNVDRPGGHVFRDELEGKADGRVRLLWSESRGAFAETLCALLPNPGANWAVVGSDAFLRETVAGLLAVGVERARIQLDKKPEQLAEFLGEQASNEPA